MAKQVEYEVRPLDQNGDAVDVWHYDTEREALKGAESATEYAAIVVERHDWRKHDAGDVCASYTVVRTFGDQSVVALWAGEEAK